ncbi:hypothetical protein COV20_04320 [Candidatus Woesearchaeota archaeon CG10_big_fil_rev_8_21_14_0_10_45_16]|nr:MAG: hypothetical protein COV20_04320 [Candidatus Woesearchaeota archaeon CG10_big_fil_rev_8_21_14_0_10_45_16]
MAFLEPVLGPVLRPLIDLSPFLAIVIISLAYALYATFVYKKMTDQPKLKEIKSKQKEFQRRMKELRSNPEEMMKVQKEAMSVNKDYMMNASFKPKVMLATMLPALLIFGWMAGSLAYEPIYPGEVYTITASFSEGVTGDAMLAVDEGTELLSDATQSITGALTWRLKSTEGSHTVVVEAAEEQQSKNVLITKDLRYEEPVAQYEKGSAISNIQINYNKLKPLGTTSIFGWQPGWLGIYVIASLVFSLILRKLMKVY